MGPPPLLVPSGCLLTHIVTMSSDFKGVRFVMNLGNFYLAWCHLFKFGKVCNYLKVTCP